ncbi:PIG-L deacetylase family protein [Paraburkholderia lycopersici]|uniref:N-acetylglucosaminyl deacetylase, LmbE family n=1 Tax=Paraburkholderia lycopersici TaxID=416944 RepID=A0A1G7C0J5_9BURK|nr:PIG-L family deacetylase [Paraburkholderia lycopersici]SDE32799.1 N-acetylglucosaminyl deacetylase, LmbE family [Paraburkholderia lycopersici]
MLHPYPHAPRDGALAEPCRAPRLIVVSPHLDDAVLGCGGLLAMCPGSVVCTVFAGEPSAPVQAKWDTASGFADSHEAIRARRREDARALALCGARPLWLDFLDAQYARYGAMPRVEAIADALAEQFARFEGYLPVCPFGLWHSDHVLVGAACRSLLRTRRLARYFAYEDAIYRAIPRVLHESFARLEADRLRASAMSAQAFGRRSARQIGAVKRRAIRAYQSQMRAFGHVPPDVERAEHYWRVERWPSSMEREAATRAPSGLF